MEKSKKIVVVDDEYFISKSLSFIFEKSGYECLTANDGQSGLDLIKKEKPALAILDIVMPKLNGYEICKEIRSDQELKNIHIIMLTGMGQESDQKASLAAGANECILKPFNPRIIQKRVTEILS